VNNYSGVSLVGTTLPYPSQIGYAGLSGATTRICATSGFPTTNAGPGPTTGPGTGNTMYTMISPTNVQLSGMNLLGIVWDCKNHAAYGIHVMNVSSSHLELAAQNCGDGTTGIAGGGAENIVMDTNSAGNSGNQHDVIKIFSSSNNYATGARLDAGGTPGSKANFNTSIDTIEDVYLQTSSGDGLVIGDVTTSGSRSARCVASAVVKTAAAAPALASWWAMAAQRPIPIRRPTGGPPMARRKTRKSAWAISNPRCAWSET
jgi:hypothetical protein